MASGGRPTRPREGPRHHGGGADRRRALRHPPGRDPPRHAAFALAAVFSALRSARAIPPARRLVAALRSPSCISARRDRARPRGLRRTAFRCSERLRSYAGPDWACEVVSPSTGVIDRGKCASMPASRWVTSGSSIRSAHLELYRLRTPVGLSRDARGTDVVRAEPFDAIELRLAACGSNPDGGFTGPIFCFERPPAPVLHASKGEVVIHGQEKIALVGGGMIGARSRPSCEPSNVAADDVAPTPLRAHRSGASVAPIMPPPTSAISSWPGMTPPLSTRWRLRAPAVSQTENRDAVQAPSGFEPQAASRSSIASKVPPEQPSCPRVRARDNPTGVSSRTPRACAGSDR